MTTRPATRRRLLNADRLYTAAVLVGAMLVPHAVLGIIGNWPDKAFNLHLVIVLLLTGCAWKCDITETAINAAVDAVRRKNKTRKAVPHRNPHAVPGEFEAITRHLRDKNA